jgi:hypothetical protein
MEFTTRNLGVCERCTQPEVHDIYAPGDQAVKSDQTSGSGTVNGLLPQLRDSDGIADDIGHRWSVA